MLRLINLKIKECVWIVDFAFYQIAVKKYNLWTSSKTKSMTARKEVVIIWKSNWVVTPLTLVLN